VTVRLDNDQSITHPRSQAALSTRVRCSRKRQPRRHGAGGSGQPQGGHPRQSGAQLGPLRRTSTSRCRAAASLMVLQFKAWPERRRPTTSAMMNVPAGAGAAVAQQAPRRARSERSRSRPATRNVRTLRVRACFTSH